MKTFENFINSDIVMYTGISEDNWESIWKDKNLKDRVTNVTSDLYLAAGFSYNYENNKLTPKRTIVEISNIPIEAFVSYRDDEYNDDDDYNSMNDMTNKEKLYIIDSYSLFLVDLYPYKDVIKTKLITM